jgi:hypothetical protein
MRLLLQLRLKYQQQRLQQQMSHWRMMQQWQQVRTTQLQHH